MSNRLYTDYRRLLAEGSKYLSAIGVDPANNHPIDALTSGFREMDPKRFKLDEAQVGLQSFREARNNLHTAAQKMEGKITAFRGATQELQAGLYGVKAKAATERGAEAGAKLKAIRESIDSVAKNVGLCVKYASKVTGFVGKVRAARKNLVESESIESIKDGVISTTKSVLRDNAGSLIADFADDSAGIAEGLVRFIGNELNHDKIVSLQQAISNASAESKTFNAAAEALILVRGINLRRERQAR